MTMSINKEVIRKNNMDTMTRTQELEEQIRYHSDLYFNQNAPEITDAEFDALVDELQAIDPTSVVLADVGAIPSYGRKVTHETPMGSLNKVKRAQDVRLWARAHSEEAGGNPQLVLSPKMDGLALRLNYVEGRLVEAATRGNHLVGMAVTDNVRAMGCIPNTLPSKLTCEVRGEGFMRKSVFKRLNDQLRREGKKPFVNPRNAASGSICCQDPKETASRELDFRWYDVKCDDMDLLEDNECQKFAWGVINLPGLEPVETDLIYLDEFPAKAMEWEANRPDLDFEIDGLVTSLFSLKDQDDSGWTSGHPNGKLAFKFKPEQAKTIVLRIDVQVGRTGVLTPICRVKPVYVAGSTVSNITLHNYGRVKELNINVGDEVILEKAGDIIPQLIRVTDRHGRPETPWLPPECCPSCGGPACLRDGEVHLLCVNPACPGKLEARVEHWLKTLEVLGIGPAAIKALCSSGLVKDLSDLYYLSVEKVSLVLGGQTLPARLVESILQRNNIPLWQFVCALGIPGIGVTTSKVLAKEYKTLDSIIELGELCGKDADGYARLCALDKIGSLTASKLTRALLSLRPTIDAIRRAIEIEDVQESSGSLSGRTFCMTGSLPSGIKRAEMTKMIEAAGGEYKSSVGKGLDYLIIADPASTSGKAVKARSLGTKCISEEQLMEMMA